MEERHKSLLRTQRIYLTEHLQPILPSVIDRLLGCDVLNENMKQEIEAEPTPVAKVRKLLDILPRRGPHAFNNFTTVLLKLKEYQILAQLDPEMAASASPGGGASTQAQPTSESTPGVYKPTSSKEEPNKPSNKVAPIPVPVQIPVAVPGGSTRPSQPSKEPVPQPQKVESRIGRQMSREIEKTQQPSEESEDIDQDLIDWPKNVDLSPKGIMVTIKDCTHQDLKKILSDTQEQCDLGPHCLPRLVCLQSYKPRHAKTCSGIFDQVYDLQSSVKGRAVIVKNITYEDHTDLKQRSNADWDAYRLQDALKRLRFTVKQYVNQSAEKLMEKLKREREEDHHNAFILVILSYGGVGAVMCTDGKEVPLRDIINVFTSENCPNLKVIPKLFFIQACGTRFNGNGSQGVSQPDEQKNKPQSGLQDATDAMKSLVLGGGDAPEDVLQNSQDMMVAIATQPDVSGDQENYLSLFILGLWTVLCKFSRNHHVLELMDKVNTLKKDSGRPVKLCEVRHSLTKKLYFLPGYMGEDQSNAESLPSLQPSLPAPNLG